MEILFEVITGNHYYEIRQEGVSSPPCPSPKCDILGHESKVIFYFPDASTGQAISRLGRRSGGAKPLERLKFYDGQDFNTVDQKK